MSRRARSILFAALAGGCALIAATITSGYRERADAAYGELRPVLIASRPLQKGAELRSKALARAVEERQVPERFMPPDALAGAAQLTGRSPAVTVPAGSYVTASLLRAPGTRPSRRPRIESGLRPVEVRISGGAAIAPLGAGVAVDVVAAQEPLGALKPGVRVLARGVQLVELREDSANAEGPDDAWVATLALERSTALRVIEADNFAREVRLIPRAG